MLKIKFWMRGTNEYNRDTIDIPNSNQTKERFEEDFRDSDECFCGGDVYELCPYFDFENGRDSIDVFLGGDEYIRNAENPVFQTSDWSQFEFVKGGGCNYIPQEPDEVGKANIWWYHDMKFNNIYYWSNVSTFDPKKLSIQYGVDQDGKKYLEDVMYDGECADDHHDHGDTGYGYSDLEFVYHPEQKFAEEQED
jgi:hypothetical protein